MNGIVLGVGMLVSAVGVSPAVEARRAWAEPVALTVNLSDDVANEVAERPSPRPALRLPRVFPNEEPRPVWQLVSSRTTQATAANRSPKVTRVVGVALGGFGGFMAGGMIGYALALKPHADDDGVSGLRGVVIGAPIGAVVGAVMGYRLTK